MERGEPNSDEVEMYMVKVVAPDGAPIYARFSMNTTVGDVNDRLATEYGENCLFLGVRVLGVTVRVAADSRPWDIDEMDGEMAIGFVMYEREEE